MYLNLKVLNQTDPLNRSAEKDLEDMENSPMDPPLAYEKAVEGDLDIENWPHILQSLVKEHEVAIKEMADFEKHLSDLKENNYQFTKETNAGFTRFFEFFDNNIMVHNEKEEKILFGMLHEKLIESGEHNGQEKPQTSINLMEDDHVKFIQLGTLAFNLFGLAMRLKDNNSRFFVLDVAYQNAKELIEMLRLHIYREDHILFPLANKLINEKEFAQLNADFKKF